MVITPVVLIYPFSMHLLFVWLFTDNVIKPHPHIKLEGGFTHLVGSEDKNT